MTAAQQLLAGPVGPIKPHNTLLKGYRFRRWRYFHFWNPLWWETRGCLANLYFTFLEKWPCEHSSCQSEDVRSSSELTLLQSGKCQYTCMEGVARARDAPLIVSALTGDWSRRCCAGGAGCQRSSWLQVSPGRRGHYPEWTEEAGTCIK